MRRFAAVFLPLVLLALSGCFQDEIVLHLNPDGSGTIEHTMIFTPAAVEQMRAMQNSFGDGEDEEEFSLFDEEEARAEAANFGEGVTYVSGRPIETTEGEGYVATYAFDDVETLDIKTKSGDGPSPGDGPQPAGTRFAFEPSSTATDAATLTISVPQAEDAEPEAASDRAEQPDSTQLAGAVEMLSAILRGFRARIVVEPQGTITSTNAAFREDGRVVLMDVSGDALLGNEEALRRLATAQDQGPSEARAAIADVPGLKVETQETVTVTFE